MAELITAVDAVDVRFPTSRELDGSDAMNPEPDYSATYVTVRTSGGYQGFGLAFTVGRGNEITVAAVRSLAPLVVGLPVAEVFADLGGFSARLTRDSQLRWLGPEKGVIHMAAAAVVNAVWDLRARQAGEPVWQLLADLPPEELVSLVDFRYIADALTPDEALAILRAAEPGRAQRREKLLDIGYPAYTTTPGWLGYSDDKLVRLAREAVADGFRQIKLKVGVDPVADERRLRLARATVGPDVRIAMDANQAWGVEQAIEWVRPLAPYDPYWIEEPTSPDVLQLDASRVAGVTENVAILLLAARFSVPVCPHAGGAGLCEMVQHLAMFDYVAVSGSTEDRAIEYVDHLHEHFVDPVRIRAGHYLALTEPGLGARMHPESVAHFQFPDGAEWAGGVAVAG